MPRAWRPLAYRGNLAGDFLGQPTGFGAHNSLHGCCQHPAGEQTGPHMPPLRVLAKPVVQQRHKSLLLLIDGPVQLRHQVIDPTGLQPALHICVKLVILAETLNARGPQIRSTNAKRADTKAHPRFDLVNAGVQALHQRIHIAAPPIVPRRLATDLYVALPGALVREVQLSLGVVGLRHRVGVKVVIQMDAIHVITLEHIQYHRQAVRGRSRLTGVHPQLVAIRLDPLWP